MSHCFFIILFTGAMLGTGLGIATAAVIGDSYVHTFAAFSTFTALSLGVSMSMSMYMYMYMSCCISPTMSLFDVLQIISSYLLFVVY